MRGICLKFIISCFGRDKTDVVPPEIPVGAEYKIVYTSFMGASASGIYFSEMISLGGSFLSMGCRA